MSAAEVIDQKRVRVFIRGSKHREKDESTMQKASCLYCFEVLGTPDENRSTSFLAGFSNATIGNYAVTYLVK